MVGSIGFIDMSIKNYCTTPCNISEERRSDLHSCGNLKSRIKITGYVEGDGMVGVFQSKMRNIEFTNEITLLDLIYMCQIAIRLFPVT